MIGIVVVSHSRALATAAIALASEMVPTGSRPTIVAAAGLDPVTFGTDATAVAEAMGRADSGDGVLVLLDIGSAVLAAELALELLEPDAAARVCVSPAPLVEGLVAAVVTASTGAALAACDAEARRGLDAKAAHLGGGAGPGREPAGAADGLTRSATVTLPDGLHARPAAALVAALAALDARVEARNATAGTGFVDALSPVDLLGLQLRSGDVLQARASGPDAEAALGAVTGAVTGG